MNFDAVTHTRLLEMLLTSQLKQSSFPTKHEDFSTQSLQRSSLKLIQKTMFKSYDVTCMVSLCFRVSSVLLCTQET